MSEAQVEVIGWIAVAFLGLAALLWLADAALGVVKSEDQRKILNRTIGGTFLGGIVAAAVALLSGDDPEPPAPPIPEPTQSPSPPPEVLPSPQPSQSASPSPSPSPVETPIPTPENEPDPPARPEFSDEVFTWAEETLPLRPFLDQPLNSAYPPCVDRLRNAGIPAGPSADAAVCFGQLEEFNRQVITQHRDRRAAYIPQLKLRASNERNAEKWRYLRQEYASFTFGEDATNYAALSAIFQCDQHLMVNLRDYGLLKERAGCPIAFTQGE